MNRYFLVIIFISFSFSMHAQKQGKKKFTKQQKRTLKNSRGFGGRNTGSLLQSNLLDVQGGMGEDSYFISLGFTKNLNKKLLGLQVLYEQGNYFDIDYSGYYFVATGGYQVFNLGNRVHLSVHGGGVISNDEFSAEQMVITDRLASYNQLHYSGIGIVDVDLGLSNRVFLVANYKQMYMINMPQGQRGRWLAGMGIRFSIN